MCLFLHPDEFGKMRFFHQFPATLGHFEESPLSVEEKAPIEWNFQSLVTEPTTCHSWLCWCVRTPRVGFPNNFFLGTFPSSLNLNPKAIFFCKSLEITVKHWLKKNCWNLPQTKNHPKNLLNAKNEMRNILGNKGHFCCQPKKNKVLEGKKTSKWPATFKNQVWFPLPKWGSI